VRRSAVGWAAAALFVAFLVVLGVPREHRALALYAFLLLAGALVLAAFVALLAAAPVGDEGRLEGAPPVPERLPPELDALERDVRETLASGAVEDRLHMQFRVIADARLARRHGVDPVGEEAQQLIGDGALGQLLAPRRLGRVRLGLRTGELAAAIAELERL